MDVLLQGEDVSMGIWMAAVGPQKYQVMIWFGVFPSLLRDDGHRTRRQTALNFPLLLNESLSSGDVIWRSTLTKTAISRE